MWDNEREKYIEQDWKRLDELDAELAETGLDNALDWEKFPELERVLDALVWNHAERWIDRSERWVELAEQAEESALSELAAFGCIEFEPQFNWSRKSTPEERGWSRAVLDIIAEVGAAEAESLFELF